MTNDHRFATEIPRPPAGLRVGDLQRWGCYWSAESGGWRHRRLEPGESVAGFGMAYAGGLFAAVYVCDDRVWLAVGTRGWDCADIVAVRQCSEGVRTAEYELSLTSGATHRIRLAMPAAVVAQRLLDPVYDEIDSWSDDVMKLFPYVTVDSWSSGDGDIAAWRSRVLPLWTRGAGHGPESSTA